MSPTYLAVMILLAVSKHTGGITGVRTIPFTDYAACEKAKKVADAEKDPPEYRIVVTCIPSDESET